MSCKIIKSSLFFTVLLLGHWLVWTYAIKNIFGRKSKSNSQRGLAAEPETSLPFLFVSIANLQ